MVDVFQEVDEQLRSQRYGSLVQRGWPFAAAAAVVILIGAIGLWGWNQHEVSEESKASVVYQAAIDALGKGDLAAADTSFAAMASSAPPAYRALALMQDAQIRLDQGKPDDAVRLFDQAAKTAPSAILGDNARLKAAFVLMDRKPLAEVEARLTPLISAKAPYRSLALEALAMARLQAGKLDEAKSDFSVLSLSQDVSTTAQARAHAAVDMITSGSAKGLPLAVATALALPPGPKAPASSPMQIGAPQ